MTTAVAIAVAALVIVNLFANVALVRSRNYSIGQKVTQSLLIWIVPLFGAFAAWVILRQMPYEPERHRDYSSPIAGGDGYARGTSFGGDSGGDGGGDGGE
jgi:hypothetical protein